MNKNNQTYMAKRQDQQVKWFVFDAAGKTLGRFASEIAKILRGKHTPTYTPHADTGDGVIIINADKIKVTGAKEAQKVYHKYTHHIGGLRATPFRKMKEKKPEYIVEKAVKGMMPKTKLGRRQLKRLRIQASQSRHTQKAQQPILVNI
ncbi:50S ribosomal protein L13 [Simkania negevensis]|uniref:Large ribosomal subunit protein uL13 n=1 Tax=Simkania negevensis TaxID=83561 RepID=A0ABS3ASB3_9BACT|nr:50S ribosomal protein L13 [Simkania negevensis]